ncbi:MAG TPA: peptidylprolyl isomerase, partial [Candidatus Kapabacteria bacterium]|nr:peptidylprolyl isomerase [Candidatus Kapabacteria bacterium]
MRTSVKITRVIFLAITLILCGMSTSTATWAASKGHSKKKETSVTPSKSKQKTNPNEVVAKVGDESITVKDIEDAFKKTSPTTSNFDGLSYDSLKSFVDLYTNYRLKLKYANDIQLEKEPDVEKELDQNRKAFAGPYLIERLVTEPAVRLMYERRKEEYHVQQIQIAFPPNKTGQPSPADTLRAYDRAQRLLKMIKDGSDFTKLAEDSSDEPTAKTTHGILRWLTAGETPRSFEDAVYSLKPGQISDQPVRTPYGYFIIKVLASEKRNGSVRSYQILLQLPPNVSRMDTLQKYALADSLLQVLRHHQATFEELAQKFSDDKKTAAQGGDMGYHSRGDRALPQEYQDALFGLSDGELCPRIVRSLYGYHIIKRGDSKPVGSFEDEKENLKVIYKRYFFQDDYNTFIASLRAKYNFAFNDAALTKFLSLVDTMHTTADSSWDKKITPDVKAMTLYTLQSDPVTIGAVIDTLRAKPELKGTALNSAGFTGFVYKQIEPQLLDLASENIEERYPEFKNLMKDVKDGILIYRLEQQEVWNKLQSQMTDSAVKAYWEPRKAQFLTAPRVDISEIYTVSDSLAKSIYARAMKGEDFAKLAKENTLRVGYKEKAG